MNKSSSEDLLRLYGGVFSVNDADINKYIELYSRIFLFDKPTPTTQTTKMLDKTFPKYIDMSKFNVSSVYANVFQGKAPRSPDIKANGINVGDGNSYVDFKIDFDLNLNDKIITFYRRYLDKNTQKHKLTLMKYYHDKNTNTWKLSAPEYNYTFNAIQPELENILQQIVSSSDWQI